MSHTPKPGTVVWTRRSPSLWWPCLLYPSWSHAATLSSLMPSDVPVQIQGCRKKIAWHHLSKNMVPMKAALGRKTSEGSKKRDRRVVAHYLGLEGRNAVSRWAAVKLSGLRPFRENAASILEGYRNKLHREDWTDLVRAVEEAAIVLEDDAFRPRLLMADWSKDENTPEFFDDWKSQSQSQRMTQFSQAGNFAAASALVAIAKESKKKEAAPKCDVDKTPQINNKRRSLVTIVDLPTRACTSDVSKSCNATTVTPVESPATKRQKQEKEEVNIIEDCELTSDRDDVSSNLYEEEGLTASSLFTQAGLIDV